jgi:hypothetical protein
MESVATFLFKFKRSQDKMYYSIVGKKNYNAVMFVPYYQYDCILLHRTVSNIFKKNKCNSDVILNINYIDFNKFIKIKNNYEPETLITFSRFQQELKILCVKYNLELYYPSILETIIYQLNYKKFFCSLYINEELFKLINQLIEELNFKSKNYDAVFLADSAYFVNAVLKRTFIESGRDAYFLNPEGRIGHYQNTESHESIILNIPEKAFSFPEKSDLSLNSKLSFDFAINLNKSKHITKSDGVRSNFENIELVKKKILYLHTFRDSSLFTNTDKHSFESNFEWVEYSIQMISNNNDWDNWFIKIHPASKYYVNENEIMNELSSKYSVPDRVVNDCPTKSQILNSRMPVFTASGTVILESLSHGFKSIFCRPRFSSELGIYASTRELWNDYLSMDYKDLKEIIEITDREIMSKGQKLFYNINEFKNINDFVPDIPMTGSDEGFVLISKLNNQINKILKSKIKEIEVINIL